MGDEDPEDPEDPKNLGFNNLSHDGIQQDDHFQGSAGGRWRRGLDRPWLLGPDLSYEVFDRLNESQCRGNELFFGSPSLARISFDDH